MSIRTYKERERERESGMDETQKERKRERIGRWQKGVEEGDKGVWYAKSISIGTKFAGLEASR